jgi:hypothetical protein
MKLASWENLFIEPVHRWRATCSLFLHYIKPFYDRFDQFHNWLLAWLVLISNFDAITEWPLISSCYKLLLMICLSLQLIRITIIFFKSIAVSNSSRSVRTNPILSIVCHGNISSLLAEQKQRLIDNGRDLMDKSSPTKLNEVLKALGTDAEDLAVVAIVFAAAAEAKQMQELRWKGRSDLVRNLSKEGLIIENVPNNRNAMFLAKELVKISPDLDVDKTCNELVLLNPPWTLNGSTSRHARARYTGPLTPALISYISGEAGIPTESIAPEFFFRPAVTGEPFIWIKSTPQFRALMAIMVNCGLTTAEIELLLKKAVDSTAADYGLPPTVDVRLYDCQFVNNKQNKTTRDLRIVGIENHGVGRIICPNDRYCATLLRKISSVPVSVSIAQNLGVSMNRIDILRVFMVLSARRKRRRRKAAHGGAGGDSEDDDDDHGNGNGDALGDHARSA